MVFSQAAAWFSRNIYSGSEIDTADEVYIVCFSLESFIPSYMITSEKESLPPADRHIRVLWIPPVICIFYCHEFISAFSLQRKFVADL